MSGRPAFKITSETLEKVEYYSRLGFNKTKIIAHLGCSKSTFFEKLSQCPELLESYERGRSIGLSEVASVLYDNAVAGNVRAIMFYLKNRAPDSWSDRPHDKIRPVHEEKESSDVVAILQRTPEGIDLLQQIARLIGEASL